ncbi:hypothetical protein D6T64_05890 [Cryobacterium melibiosiphilum]|uniref:Uncharacterized protein n=1 Tax=Cryobacterium melibiosiphilum TaxID=995039 RepID=A0A3A5MLA0_9MICO|nr:hypothetical protein [Cryobacterium melibiosiphilum]RJT89751.1 hypothetical protein D6T64_05890 [Cryobacterium melibiosiphilum]
MTSRRLAPGQRSQICIGGPGPSASVVVFETADLLVEAPNWSLDGRTLYLNGAGCLWSLDLATPDRGLHAIDRVGLLETNNDHVLDPDGEHVYLSANDGHIYRALLSGGPGTLNVNSWAPDSSRFAFVAYPLD